MPKAGATYSERELERLAAKERREGVKPLDAAHGRPKTRGECVSMPRPCPYVGCRYHLFLHVTQRGGLQFPFGDDVSELERMPATCTLDVADQGYISREALAKIFNVSQQALVPLGHSALARIGVDAGLSAHAGIDAQPVFTEEEHIRDRYGPHRYEVRRRRHAAQAFAAATMQG